MVLSSPEILSRYLTPSYRSPVADETSVQVSCVLRLYVYEQGLRAVRHHAEGPIAASVESLRLLLHCGARGFNVQPLQDLENY